MKGSEKIIYAVTIAFLVVAIALAVIFLLPARQENKIDQYQQLNGNRVQNDVPEFYVKDEFRKDSISDF